MVARSFARVLLVTALWVHLGVVTGCTPDPGRDDPGRDAAVYRSVIDDLVDRSGVVLDDSDGPPVLFVDGLAAEIPLRVQVDVVAEFAGLYEIRFIDDMAEAVETEEPGRPVRGGGVLVGLGPVVGDEVATVRGEFYLHRGGVEAYSYELTSHGESRWVILGEPESIAPEGFAPGP